MNENNDNRPNRPKRPKRGWFGWVLILLMSLTLTYMVWSVMRQYKEGTVTQIKYSQFMEMLENGQIDSLEISDTSIVIHPKTKTQLEQEALMRQQEAQAKEANGEGKSETSDTTEEATTEAATQASTESGTIFDRATEAYDSSFGKVTYTTIRVYDLYLVDKLEEAGVEYEQMKDNSNAWWVGALQFAVLLVGFYLIMALVLRLATRGKGGIGGIMNVGKSRAKVYVEKKTGVTFADVAGQEEAKESLVEMVDFLHNPQRYTAIGAKLPRGALLVGPPGTGKTLLAKAVAGEAEVPFFSLAGSDFVEMYVGVGASRVRDLFKDANNMAPCIIFIDEIDAIGRSRDSVGHGGDSEREQTLNQLLSEMDGFDTSKGIVILAATNRPEVLDKALLRPGRFDRRVIVEKPDLKGRVDTLKVHSKDVRMDETVDFEELALATAGAVGADLANIINEAALLAVKNGRQAVSQADLFESVEVVFAGKEKKDRILSKQEKKVVAYHEIGHALVIALQKHTEPVQKITIIPRTMGALGYVMQVPEEEKYLRTKEEMLADLVVDLGGRAAEEIKFASVSTGASNDIEKATNTARNMITLYGMSERFGNVALESIQNRYLDGRRVMNCSEETATEIDKEVQKMIKTAYKQALKLMRDNEALLDKLANYLIKRETITGKEFMTIFNKEMGIKPKKSNKDSLKAKNRPEMLEAFPPISEKEKQRQDLVNRSLAEIRKKQEGEGRFTAVSRPEYTYRDLLEGKPAKDAEAKKHPERAEQPQPEEKGKEEPSEPKEDTQKDETSSETKE